MDDGHADEIEPLDGPTVEARCTSAVSSGRVIFTGHAEDEMEEDELVKSDIRNALRAGWFEQCDYENGAWRYRVCTNKLTTVVEFQGESTAVVVTAWRQ